MTEKKTYSADLERRFQEIARRMFLASGDGDYLMARQAYRVGLANQFWWSTSQAVEKYLKTVLLMHGRTSKVYSHALNGMWTDVSALGIPDTLLVRAKENVGVESHGGAERQVKASSLSTFVELATRHGSPDSRYNHFGHEVYLEDLYSLDEFVWEFRGYCRPAETQTHDVLAPWRIAHDCLLEDVFDDVREVQHHKVKREMLTWSNPIFGFEATQGKVSASQKRDPFFMLKRDLNDKSDNKNAYAAVLVEMIECRIILDDDTRKQLGLAPKHNKRKGC